MKSLFVLLAACLLFTTGFSASITPKKANPSDVRFVPVQPTPEPDNVETTIVFPQDDEVLNTSSVNVQIRLVGFPVGIQSDFDRKNEIYNDPMGQSMLVFVDDDHPIEIYKSFIDSLDQNNLFFRVRLTTQIPYRLKKGKHVIRAFPDRSYGESLKKPGAYQASVFYVDEKIDNLDANLRAPYLTYNEPLETMKYRADRPLLLDFYLSNVQLSQDGYKVKVIIDGDIERILTRWVPYYIYGLDKGKHTIELQLLNPRNKIEPGVFNRVKRTITVD